MTLGAVVDHCTSFFLSDTKVVESLDDDGHNINVLFLLRASRTFITVILIAYIVSEEVAIFRF